MGTRNLTCVIEGGAFRVAQYGQWDGYPEGAGFYILKFLSDVENIKRLRDRVKDLHFISAEEWNNRLRDAGIPTTFKVNSEEERKYQVQFWQLDRNLGRNILGAILTTEGQIDLEDSREFALDSLFCEWAYVIDLDRNVFEVYKGFNKNPNANFGVFANVASSSQDTNGYAPVALMKSYPLDKLPTTDQLKAECDPKDDEDD